MIIDKRINLCSSEALWALGFKLKPPKGQVNNQYNVLYKSRYRQVMNKFNEALLEELVKGNTVILPASMGKITIVLKKREAENMNLLSNFSKEELACMDGKKFSIEYVREDSRLYWISRFINFKLGKVIMDMLHEKYIKTSNVVIPFYDAHIAPTRFKKKNTMTDELHRFEQYFKDLNNW